MLRCLPKVAFTVLCKSNVQFAWHVFLNWGQAQASEQQPYYTPALGVCNFLALRLCFTLWISDFAPFRSFWLINHGCRVLLQAACYNIWLITSADRGIVVQWARSHLARHDSILLPPNRSYFFFGGGGLEFLLWATQTQNEVASSYLQCWTVKVSDTTHSIFSSLDIFWERGLKMNNVSGNFHWQTDCVNIHRFQPCSALLLSLAAAVGLNPISILCSPSHWFFLLPGIVKWSQSIKR